MGFPKLKPAFFLLLLAGFFLNNAFAQDGVQGVFEVEVKFVDSSQTAEINSLRVIKGTPDSFEEKGNYAVKLLDHKNEVLFENNYTIVFLNIIHGNEVENQNIDAVLKKVYMPYSSQAFFIVVEKSNKEILKYSLQEQTCNNDKVCDFTETSISCTGDCDPELPDGYCDKSIDGFCDPDCGLNVDFDCRQKLFKYCGNGVCNESESMQSCRVDCSGSSDGFCDKIHDQRCDPDCRNGEDADCGTGFCNNNRLCDVGENESNCPNDCVKITDTGTDGVQPANSPGFGSLPIVAVLLVLVTLGALAWHFVEKKK